MSQGNVSPEVAFFLKGLVDDPNRIAVSEKNGFDIKEVAIEASESRRLRDLVLPCLQRVFSDPSSEVVTKAAEFLNAIQADIQGDSLLFSFEEHPEKMVEVLEFFQVNGVVIPNDLKNLRDYFTF